MLSLGEVLNPDTSSTLSQYSPTFSYTAAYELQQHDNINIRNHRPRPAPLYDANKHGECSCSSFKLKVWQVCLIQCETSGL